VGVFWRGLFGFSCRFWGSVGFRCFRGKFGCLMRASFVFWVLGVMGTPCVIRVLGLIIMGLFRFFLFVG